MADANVADANAQGAARRPGKPIRRRWPLVVGIVLVVLIVGVVVLDGVARGATESFIATKLRESLGVPASTSVEVSVKGTPVLSQLAAGRLNEVDITIADLKLDGFSGAVEMRATGVPLDQSEPIERARLGLTVTAAELRTLVNSITDFPIDSVAVSGANVSIGTHLTVLGLRVPIALALRPSAAKGELLLTPVSFGLAGNTVTASGLRNALGSVVEPLLKTRSICVAGDLPVAVTLDSVTTRGSAVQFSVVGRQIGLGSEVLSTKGRCAGS